MRFDRLRLVGFKSFVEPTDFHIERGLTGVVGPNGCGKSNLVEALRWVMGEASYKNMRASSMDDVIFSGSGNRPARNMAEVLLTLANPDRDAPAAFNDADELNVSRRIQREAGSVYRVNGRDVRAKDVQLLFADVSTGARSPSMIGQGRVSELIAAKPQARRAILEEAAGISGLHSRRHEAELRLRGAEQNLDRLEDVIGQLETQLDSLKRQARQASRYRNIAGDIHRTEATILHLRWRAAREAAREAEAALQKATVRVGEAGLEQGQAAREQAVVVNAIPPLRKAEAERAAALQRATILRDQLDKEERTLLKRRSDLEARVEQLVADLSREERMVEENSDIVAHLDREETLLTEQTAAFREERDGLRDAVDEAARRAERAETEASSRTSELAQAEAQERQSTTALRDARARRERLEWRRDEAARERDEVARRLNETSDVSAREEEVQAATVRVEELEARIADAEGAAATAAEAEADALERIAPLRSRADSLEAEARTLRAVLSSDASGRFLPVLEELTPEPGYEAALAAALGADLDVSRNEQAAVHWSGASVGDDPELPAGASRLLDHVNAPDALARRLAQVGVVDELPDDPTLRPGQCLVTRDGSLLRWDGLRQRADAETPAAQRLQQRNRLKDLEGEIEEVSRALDVAVAVHARAKSGSVETNAAARELRSAIGRARQALEAARRTLERSRKAAADLLTRRAALDEVQGTLDEDLADAAQTIADTESAAASLPDVPGLKERAEAAREALSQTRRKASEANAAFEGAERDDAVRADRLGAIERERASWTQRAKGAERQIAILAERRDAAAAQLEELAAEPDAFEARRRTILSTISAAEAQRNDAADALAAKETELREADRVAQGALAKLSDTKQDAARAEERVTAARERLGEAEARIREDLQVQPHEALGVAETAEDRLPPLLDAERKLERLRAERERMGAVNLRAEEEASEIRERRDDIVAERDDLVEAIRKLRAGIQALNTEGRERLLDAFEKVDAQFQRLFSHLFGGGTAKLQLVDSDDPLDAGLEIMARPPGKKPQTMTLLSGGEQALTAMALVFAVFLTNPAPICVLDEVDAPLDDHNVERFCNLLDEMAASTDTRFVIITHNPITMSRMNRLFGVTMAERGVSQLVSVDLETAESYAEAS